MKSSTFFDIDSIKYYPVTIYPGKLNGSFNNVAVPKLSKETAVKCVVSYSGPAEDCFVGRQAVQVFQKTKTVATYVLLFD